MGMVVVKGNTVLVYELMECSLLQLIQVTALHAPHSSCLPLALRTYHAYLPPLCQKHHPKAIPLQHTVRFASQIASAMHFLH